MRRHQPKTNKNIKSNYYDGLVQGRGNSNASAMRLLQSCTKPLIWWSWKLICHGNIISYNPKIFAYWWAYLNDITKSILAKYNLFVHWCGWWLICTKCIFLGTFFAPGTDYLVIRRLDLHHNKSNVMRNLQTLIALTWGRIIGINWDWNYCGPVTPYTDTWIHQIVPFTWGQFYSSIQVTSLFNEFDNHTLRLLPHLLRANELIHN